MPAIILTLIAWWGGTLFLLNKYFFLRAEISPKREKEFKVRSWQVYLIGLPAWLVVFYFENDFIAFAVEMSGLPAMVLGLLLAQNADATGARYAWLEWLALVAIPLGVYASVTHFGGFGHFTQWLETLLAVGFLIGTYLLAKDRRTFGYMWYLLMNGANTELMWLQNYRVLAAQQAISIVIMISALFIRLKRKQIR